ncbi:hypothetical protein E2C01_043364 [Portunus trituberculatus]|uniref:Uncharacterized protein n=1 Tax=Portunus trituberculatus TaxID=210409 RepID=A0A5B7FXC8_PORTR|nr:hypothetical protein [Portunus trituberculatus]
MLATNSVDECSRRATTLPSLVRLAVVDATPRHPANLAMLDATPRHLANLAVLDATPRHPANLAVLEATPRHLANLIAIKISAYHQLRSRILRSESIYCAYYVFSEYLRCGGTWSLHFEEGLQPQMGVTTTGRSEGLKMDRR